LLRGILDPLLRSPRTVQAPAPRKRESVLHSALFSAEPERETSRTDTPGWAHPVKMDDAEGGV
jgi:hypothetical protein